MRYDLTDLRLFLAVVDTGSITHGAARANLSLPAASERLRDLERSGGLQLLDRGRRGTAPTSAGETLAHHARLVLRQLDRMHGELAEFGKGIRTTVQLLANTAAMTEYLPERLGPWLASHPRIDVDLKERQSSDIVKAVSSGLAEIGVIADSTDHAVLQTNPFAVDRLVVVAARDDVLAKRKELVFSTLLDREFVGLSEGALQDHIEAQAVRLGRRLKLRFRVRNFDGICRMAAQGIGLGIIPEPAAQRCRRSMRISLIRLADGWASRRLSVCFRSQSELTPVAADLAAHLSAGAARQR